MNNKLRKCKQCGDLKNIDQFRKYYNSSGYYKVCKTCESINSRYNYLVRKQRLGTTTSLEEEEITKIDELYELLRARGLNPPRRRNEYSSAIDAVEEIMAKKLQEVEDIKSIAPDIPLEAPPELIKWLEEELQGYDPEELEDVSDMLWEKYRPQTGVDKEFKPIYDDKFKDVLTRIQERFDTYTDEFYS